MPRGLRPYCPVEVQCRVALRQLGEICPDDVIKNNRRHLGKLLNELLPRIAERLKCPVDQLHRDHDPPLAARKKVYDKAGKHIDYDPPANSVEHQLYRPYGAEFDLSHKIKTNVRGEHGQHPDRVLIKKNRKMERREAGIKERPKAKVRGLTFQQQRCRLGARCRCDRRSRKTCKNYSNLKTRKSR